ncbi:hypothetical protein IV52_GL000646 [Fructilactobacillus lindneri DSM 20690 = JCM 11027]|uniref:Cytochrome d ubiquinol oxidase subunit II n=2 Tax=Fructilactobacillus lindneri TaxID=53444 RepID=A0A0R2JTV8_9LACO|nr:hypothetical protein IV52_GL000646 [Fructilactobacillus lindneri DSM 20690 = JCM 11027]
MATRFLCYNDTERGLVLRTIGAHWNGNEVFLVTAGGAMFASIPLWYASLFSGFYIVLFLILIALIFRGVSFEFSENAETKQGKNRWMWANFFGSLFLPFLFGILFMDMIQPVPMDSQGNIFASFWNVINPLSLLGGIALTAICLYQGLHYISLHTTGLIEYKSERLADNLYWAAYPVEVLLVVALYFQTNFFERHLYSTLILLVLIVAMTVWGQIASAKDHEWQAYFASSLSLVFIVMLVFVGLFPYVLIAENPAHSILITQASSTPYTLTAMTIALVILLPIMLAYFIWSYIYLSGRISLQEYEKMEKQDESY